MNILLTGSWVRTAYVAAESLAKAGWEVFVCGSNFLSMTRFSRFIQGFDLVSNPFKEPEQYVKELAQIVKQREIDVLLPVHEDALSIQTYRHYFPENLIIACASEKELLIVLDKYEIIKIAEAAQVGVPQTYAPYSIAEVDFLAKTLGFPLIIKTRRGNSGKGVFRVNSAQEAVNKYQEVIENFSLTSTQMPILQQYLEGSLYGGCFLAKEGEVKACFIEHYLRCKEEGFGTSVLRKPCVFPLLEDYTKKMAQKLKWTGIGHFDFIVNAEKTSAYLIEMNPRFWGALNLAVKNGYDFPRGLITMLTSDEPDNESFQPVTVPISSLWIAGEMIAGVAEFRSGKSMALLMSLKRILFPGRACKYDDFRWHDPLPLLVELAHYGSSFISSGGKINPVYTEMMH